MKNTLLISNDGNFSFIHTGIRTLKCTYKITGQTEKKNGFYLKSFWREKQNEEIHLVIDAETREVVSCNWVWIDEDEFEPIAVMEGKENG